jgi:hypothetical protein
VIQLARLGNKKQYPPVIRLNLITTLHLSNPLVLTSIKVLIFAIQPVFSTPQPRRSPYLPFLTMFMPFFASNLFIFLHPLCCIRVLSLIGSHVPPLAVTERRMRALLMS